MWETIIVAAIIAAAGASMILLLTRAGKEKSGCGGCCSCRESVFGDPPARKNDHQDKCEHQTER